MKSLIAKITAWLVKVKATLVTFGAFGVFAIAILDASFLPIPGGPDAVVMTLSHLNHGMMPLYVLAVVLGSTLGCLFPYWIGRKTGEAALRRFSDEKRARVARLIEQYDVWAMLVGAVLPPPFPFKLFLLTAGVFRMQVWRFLLSLAAGRIIRFSLEGWMAVRYGEQAAQLFKQHYPKIGLGIAALVIIVFLVNKFLNRNGDGGMMTEGDLTTAE